MIYWPEIWDLWTILSLGTLLLNVLLVFWMGWVLSPVLDRRFEEATSGYVGWMVRMFDRMFYEASPRLCGLSILAAMVSWFTLGMVLTMGMPEGAGYLTLRLMLSGGMAVGIPKTPLGMQMPRFVVEWMWARRMELFKNQLVDALTYLANGLKSGLSVIQAMEMVVEELPNPISQEFSVVLDEQRLGVPFEDCMLNLEERIPTEDIQILVTSVNILRQSGGNLAETFDTIAETIRERQKVEGKIVTLTAMGVTQGRIITVMPFFLAGTLWLLDPVLISRLWTTGLGWLLLTIMFVLQLSGSLMIRKVVKIDV